jgi:hypothetical protein
MTNHTERAIRQIRNASTNLHRAAGFTPRPRPPISKLLTVLANSLEIHGHRNRAQVEGALANYFDAIAKGEAK